MFEIYAMASTLIAEYHGVEIRMLRKPREHEPAHIHISHAEFEATFELKTLKRKGSSKSELKSIAEVVIKRHFDELMNMWKTQDIHEIDISHDFKR